MSEVEQMAAVLAEHAGVTIRRLPADRRGICRNERVCTCGEVMPWDEQGATDAHCAHVAAELARAGFGAVGAHNESCATTDQWRDQRDRADRAEAALASAKADAQSFKDGYERAMESLTLTERRATSAETACATAATDALREAAGRLGRYRNGATGKRPANGLLFSEMVWEMANEIEYQQERATRADQIARTDESERA